MEAVVIITFYYFFYVVVLIYIFNQAYKIFFYVWN